MKRIIDLVISIIFLLVAFIPIIFVSIAILLTSKGSLLYWSDRVGKNNLIFSMPKFRSMKIDPPAVATHLLSDPDQFVSSIGKILRKTSLDELPQIYSVIKGDMSFVGPRPALYNQDDLIALRKEHGLDRLLPGITGWAQVNGRDELTIHEKVMFEIEYKNSKSFWFDLKILWMTFLKVFRGYGVKH